MGKIDKEEMLGSIIDIFEDWLAEKGITENECFIAGNDYDYLSEKIEQTLVNYGLIKEE